jgi:hypothetical protein
MEHESSWVPVVRSTLPLLTAQLPDWAVLKNHAELPNVTGDIDLCVPRARWDAFVDAYQQALGAIGTYAVVSCDHFLGVRLVFAVPLHHECVQALEVDLADGVWWKGTRLLKAAQLLEHAIDDARGFRRLPGGFEAAYQLTVNVLPRGGEKRDAVYAKATVDADRFCQAMRALHGVAGGRAAERFLAGELPTWRGLPLTARRMLRGMASPLARPASFARRKASGHWRGLPRRVDGSTAAWLERVGRGHPWQVAGTNGAGVHVLPGREAR